MTESFDNVLQRFTAAVEAGDADGLAALFTEDGVYHDGFYGAFEGRRAIADMIADHFWGHAEGFRWRMFDPVCDGRMGYARYRFSYRSKLPGVEGEPVVFEGMSQFTLRDGLIACYREEFNTGVAISQLKFDPERIASHLRKKAAAVRSRE